MPKCPLFLLKSLVFSPEKVQEIKQCCCSMSPSMTLGVFPTFLMLMLKYDTKIHLTHMSHNFCTLIMYWYAFAMQCSILYAWPLILLFLFAYFFTLLFACIASWAEMGVSKFHWTILLLSFIVMFQLLHLIFKRIKKCNHHLVVLCLCISVKLHFTVCPCLM